MADRADPNHAALVETLERWPGELVVSAFTAAEADHLILSRLGIDAELAFIDDLALTYSVRSLEPDELKEARSLCERYRDLELGLSDASIVVLAHRWRTRAIATFDHKHFRTVPAIAGGSFRLLPADREP